MKSTTTTNTYAILPRHEYTTLTIHTTTSLSLVEVPEQDRATSSLKAKWLRTLELESILVHPELLKPMLTASHNAMDCRILVLPERPVSTLHNVCHELPRTHTSYNFSVRHS
eukprot:1615989-Pleurochrysis_carterae.AAC.1